MSIESIKKRLDECPWIGAYVGGTPGVLTSEQERLLLDVAEAAYDVLHEDRTCWHVDLAEALDALDTAS